VIALVGALRSQEQRSIAQIHQELQRPGVQRARRTVTDQLYREEELLALHLADVKRLRERLEKQEQVILALDGLQPDVGQEVLWVLRDGLSYEHLLSTMTTNSEKLGELAHAVTHFCKVTASYWEGLFACYQLKDLPRTNNGLEQYFGSARHGERGATGRKRASPALVVPGAVRVVAAGASRLLPISAIQLQVTDEVAWRALRQQLTYRHECRRCQLRFRRDPDVYLAALEHRLLTPSLPS
jgi:hypothetical protein